MPKHYKELYKTIVSTSAINTHSHHREDEFFAGFNLDKILRSSYVDWCQEEFDDTRESRARYLKRVQYKSFFRELQRALMEIYGFQNELSAESWDEYNDVIAKKHEDATWQIDILKNICHYEKIILDAYWNPGHDDGHPELFATTFRIDPLFFGYDKDVFDHDGNNAYTLYGETGKDIDGYMEFVYNLIKSKISEGSVCIKNAIAYDRNIAYKPVKKAEASRVFQKKDYSTEDVANFQDYFFDGVCKIAAELHVPIQCHTGMGMLENTRAINMLNIIRENPGTVFSLMHGSFPWCSDILAYLDMYPNVYSDIVWLPSLSPKTAEYMLHQLIEVGTSNRIVWGCDTWNSEESYAAKLTMADVLARVLDEKIEREYFGLDDAHDIIKNIMHGNAAELFKIKG